MIGSADSAAMGIDDRFAQGKANAHSLVSVTGLVGIYAASVKKGTEDLWLDPFSIVLDGDSEVVLYSTFS